VEFVCLGKNGDQKQAVVKTVLNVGYHNVSWAP
jgi:hypothetical protein